jgi:hypothetical protein
MVRKDFTGQVVEVGDYIFYSTTGRYAESRIGRVTRFTEKSLWVEIVKMNRPNYGTLGTEVVVRNDFAKITYTPKAPKPSAVE